MNNKFFAYAEVFVAVVRCNSITLAAQELKTTKSNVSQKLSDFEALLDLKLLYRTTRRMELTPAGARVFKTCSDAVDAAIIAASTLSLGFNRNIRPQGKVILSGSNTYLTKIVLPNVRGFLEEYRDIKLVLIGSDRKVDFVAEDVDLGIRIGPVEPAQTMSAPLQPLSRILCASPAFLASHKMPQHPGDLAGLTYIVREQEKPVWQLQKGKEIHRHHVTGAKITSNTIETAHAAALNGLGLCVLASVIVESDILQNRLCRVLPEWDIAPLPVTMLWRQSRILKPQVNLLHKHLIARLNPS